MRYMFIAAWISYKLLGGISKYNSDKEKRYFGFSRVIFLGKIGS